MLVVLVAALSAIYAGFAVVLARRTRRELAAASPRGVLERLAAHPATPVHLDIRQGGLVWKPGVPLGVRNFLYGPGHARFSQDAEGLICLDWTPRWGRELHVRGPVPAMPEEHAVPFRHTAKIVGALLGIYLLVLGMWLALSSL